MDPEMARGRHKSMGHVTSTINNQLPVSASTPSSSPHFEWRRELRMRAGTLHDSFCPRVR
jgi:hypothetical protein